jgi:hypothetical protein
MNIILPIKIFTPKIARNKTNSLFYAGQNIAEVKVLNRTYVLTTAGQYRFSLDKKTVNFNDNLDDKIRAIISKLTDRKIKALDDQGNVQNWGWFGINVWNWAQLLPISFNCFSEYDEAMKAFVTEVTKNIQGKGK